ncbi:MAG TPA: UDP-N-acetylglucosamine 2-epimerase (non-hydrolyzing) [Methanophagales archaeon]|nr:UDP-N-acetylglucosamine 2-epimerase (non-hydrolyzing) [Methanophagales archaeon]
MRIAIIMGTRPEIIKMSPVIEGCEELELPGARYNLDVGSNRHGKQTGEMLIGIEKVLQEELPSLTLVEGDTNTVLAGALAAAKQHITLGHVEAGLRSCDRNMPEEINRIVADHVSDYLFAPTEKAKGNLLREGIGEDEIFITGNTIVDAIYQNQEIARRKIDILIEPVGFLEFLQLEASAKLILTDSGGVQEEACILKVPCVTLRDNTERQETLAVDSNMLAGIEPEKILDCSLEMIGKRKWETPFGDGKAGNRIVEIITR